MPEAVEQHAQAINDHDAPPRCSALTVNALPGVPLVSAVGSAFCFTGMMSSARKLQRPTYMCMYLGSDHSAVPALWALSVASLYSS